MSPYLSAWAKSAMMSSRSSMPTDTRSSICTARFHRIREHQVWLDDDLEDCKLNAVLVTDFPATEP